MVRPYSLNGTVPKERKFHLIPKSDRGRRFGDRPRNVVWEMDEGERMFLRFEGWNRWVWVQKRDDPHYTVRRGWSDNGSPIPLYRKGPRD